MCLETEEEYDVNISYREYKEFLENNKDTFVQVFRPFGYIDSHKLTGHGKKCDSDFTNLLQKIKKGSPGSQMNIVGDNLGAV
jgi:hypothetical protein